MTRPARIAAIVALGLLAGRPALADYKESYKKAMEAVDRQNWPEVARLMRQAAAENPREGERIKLYGMRFEEYLPQYYLGLALFHGGDCEGAVAAWQASEGQGAVQKAGVYKTLTRHKGTCEARIAQSKPKAPAGPDPAAVARAAQGAEAAIAQAEKQAASVAALQGDPALAGTWGSDAALGGAQRQAAETLSGAKARLDSGKKKPDLGELQQAQEMASRAGQQMDALLREATARRDAARRAAADKAAPAPAASPSAAAAAATGPPAELLTAARAYFTGQYTQAVALLGRVSAGSGRSGAQSMLLRAASRHALYLLSGRADDQLRKGAEADVRACRQLDPSFAPDPRFFSPRFTDFFRAVR